MFTIEAPDDIYSGKAKIIKEEYKYEIKVVFVDWVEISLNKEEDIFEVHNSLVRGE